jgi:hypothetical protein
VVVRVERVGAVEDFLSVVGAITVGVGDVWIGVVTLLSSLFLETIAVAFLALARPGEVQVERVRDAHRFRWSRRRCRFRYRCRCRSCREAFDG